MIAPSHAIGGLTFTALFASLHDVNILEKPQYIALTIFLSLLPDVDLPTSTTGRILFPISRLISAHYPHRTITHSFTALALVAAPFYFINSNYFVIAIYSYFSHCFLDMFTLQGVQFLSPFSQAIFVLPGDRDYRCSSTSFKANLVVVLLSCFVFFHLQNSLFANGFWNTINSSFGTIQNTRSEFVRSGTAIIGHMSLKQGSYAFRDTGYIIQAEPNKITYLKDSIFYTVPNKSILLLHVANVRSECDLSFRDTLRNFNNIDSAEYFINSFPVSRLILSSNYRLMMNTHKTNSVNYNFDEDFPNRIDLQELKENRTYIAYTTNYESSDTDTSYSSSLLRYENYITRRTFLISKLQSEITEEEREHYARELRTLREISKPQQRTKHRKNNRNSNGYYQNDEIEISVNLTYAYIH